MSYLRVYVNETVSCSLIFDTSEVTLETFCHETLDTKVDDVLNFPYKFTRMVNNKRVVMGLKQERILKLKQYIEESKVKVLFTWFAKIQTRRSQNSLMSRNQVLQGMTSRSRRQRKLRFLSSPHCLICLCQTARQLHPNPVHAAARARKIKIFSATEIEESTGMQKIYREFWNAKAEELCRSSALKTFKPGEIQGAINVAWTIRKTEYLKDEMETVNQEINDKCPVDVLKKFQLSGKTLKKNCERVETAFASLQDLQRDLTSARQEYFDSSSKSERRAASVKVTNSKKTSSHS